MGNEVILRFLADTGQLDAAYSRLVAKTSATQKALESIGRSGSAMSKMGRSLTHGVTAPVIALGGAAAVLGYQWDKTWTRVSALTNLSVKEIDKAKASVLQLSKYGVAPQELADGFYFLASAGLTTKQAMDTLNVTAKAASVGLGDYSGLAQTVSTSLLVWKNQNLTAAQSVDTMIAAVKAGKMEPEKMATNLGKIAGQAAAVGVSMRELAGAMASANNGGQSAEAAAVGLGQIINHLSKPTAAASKEAKRLGLNFGDLKKTIKDKGLIAAMTEVQTKTHGNDKSIRTLLANQQAVRTYYALMRNGGKDTAETMREMGQATWSLDKALEKTAGSPSHKLAVAWAELKAKGIEWGQVLLPKLAELAQKATALMDRFNKLTPAQREQALKFLAIAAAIGPVLYAAGKLTSAFAVVGKSWKGMALGLLLGLLVNLYKKNEDFRNSVNGVAQAMAGGVKWAVKHKGLLRDILVAVVALRVVSGVFKAAAAAQKAWAAVAALFNAVMAANPVMLVVLAIGALVAGLIIAYRHSERFRQITQTVWQYVKVIAGNVISWLVRAVQVMFNFFFGQIDLFVQAAAKLFGWVPGIGPKLKAAAREFEAFRDNVNGTFDDIADAAGGWGDKAARAVSSGFVNGVETTSPGLLAAVGQNMLKVNDALHDPAKYAREAGVTAVNQLTAGIVSGRKHSADVAAATGRLVIDQLRQQGLAAKNVGAGVAWEYGHGVTSGAPVAKSAAAGLGKAARDAAASGNPLWQQTGEDAALGFSRGIGARVSGVITAARQMALAAIASAKKTMDSHSPSRVMFAEGKNFVDGMALGISASAAGAVAAASDLTKQLIAAVAKGKAKVQSETKDVWDALHPGKDSTGKAKAVNQTTVRHQREQLAAAQAELRANQLKLAASRREDAALAARRRAGVPLANSAQNFLAPFLSQVIASEGPITAAANKMADALQKQFGDKSGKLPATIATVKAHLLDLSKEAADLHKSVFDGLAGSSNVVSAFSGQDATSGDMRAFLEQRVSDFTALGSGLSGLAAKGIPTSLLKELAMGGVDALPMVRSLLGASNTDLAAIIRAQGQVDRLANSTASQVEQAVYSGTRRGLSGTASGASTTFAPGSITIQVVSSDPKAAGQSVVDALMGLG